MKSLILLALALMGLAGCTRHAVEKRQMDAAPLITWQRFLAEAIRQDIFPPPQVSRIFSYSQIAAYEALRPAYPGNRSFAGQLLGLQAMPLPADTALFDAELAALTAYMKTASFLVFNEKRVDAYYRQWADSLSRIINNERIVANSIAYGDSVFHAIKRWAGADNFRETRSMTRYTLMKDDHAWQPTPPSFATAFEPHWNLIRTFVVDSTMVPADIAMPPFDKAKGSGFYSEALTVYELSKTMPDSLAHIAWYWDDNPNTTIHTGHVMIKVQKHSPPAHWMAIAAQATQDKRFDAARTAQTLALTAIATHDAFVHCWQCKYKYNILRPVTYINRYIDPEWQSIIQTPPFPETPSGHSSVSQAAAVVLTHMIGDHHRFIDSTNRQFDLGVREFPSFYAAAAEAKMSRLYGGIHFPFGNETGAALGDTIGKLIVNKINLR